MRPKTSSKSTPRAKPLKLTNGRGSWNSTSRRDRAIIRILATHGLRDLAIANHVGFSPGTVKNILKKRLNKYAEEDESRDYDFVSAEFRAVYPPLSSSDKELAEKGKKPKVEVVDVDMDKSSSRQVSAPSLSHARSISRSESLDVGPPAPASGSSVKGPTNAYQNRPKMKSSGDKDDPIEVDSPQSVLDFLLHLDHDLSGIFDTLNDQDLGTPEKLFAIASWPEETLHRLFREMLPGITITQRFVLVRGLKDRVVAVEN